MLLQFLLARNNNNSIWLLILFNKPLLLLALIAQNLHNVHSQSFNQTKVSLLKQLLINRNFNMELKDMLLVLTHLTNSLFLRILLRQTLLIMLALSLLINNRIWVVYLQMEFLLLHLITNQTLAMINCWMKCSLKIQLQTKYLA